MAIDHLPHPGTFAEAAESSSFTAAARKLGLTQAAVSQRVQALEQALGVALFDRRAGRVQLTEAGRRLHGYAQRILALEHEARQEVTGRRTPVAGELSLAASSVPGEHLLPRLLAAFRRKHPHIQVRATVADSQVVLNEVEHGRAHLGLVGKKGNSPHLEYRCFACDTLVLVVPPGHPWARRRRVSLEQVGREPLILRETGSGSLRRTTSFLLGSGMGAGSSGGRVRGTHGEQGAGAGRRLGRQHQKAEGCESRTPAAACLHRDKAAWVCTRGVLRKTAGVRRFSWGMGSRSPQGANAIGGGGARGVGRHRAPMQLAAGGAGSRSPQGANAIGGGGVVRVTWVPPLTHRAGLPVMRIKRESLPTGSPQPATRSSFRWVLLA
jgi:DNA-binding transcriptional LysR family regulator